MAPDPAARLEAYAGVIVRVGLNLQRGQRLLIGEPYELQGVTHSAGALVEAVRAAAEKAGCPGAEVIWGDGGRLRRLAEETDGAGFETLVSANAARMRKHLASGGAFLFLIGHQPGLMDGLPVDRVNELHQISWRHFGPIVQQLLKGASQWTLAPAPSPAWAQAVLGDLPVEERLGALWNTVLAAVRCDRPDPVLAWQEHLAALARRRDELNRRRHPWIRYQGEGTDLSVGLPDRHVWQTAARRTRSGVPFVQNLPTEEVFTAPHKNSTEGYLQVARPVSYGGSLIRGIRLKFQAGRVVRASAESGADLLQRLLETDGGASRLGEVAMIPGLEGTPAPWQRSGRLFHQTLLDENAAHHVALGEAYRFCLDSFFPFALNRSLIHVDLPLDARVVPEPC